MVVLQFLKLSAQAHTPTKGSYLAAGYDLSSAVDVTILPWSRLVIPTDLKILLPPGTYGRIAPRSGLAIVGCIDVCAGVVDADYCGPLKVVLVNHSNVEYQVRQGDRIAQLICEKIVYPQLLEVDHLPETGRGAAGFGSTGL